MKKVDLRGVINRLNEYWNSPRYVPLDNTIGSMRFVETTRKAQANGIVKTDEELDYLYRWVIVNKGLRLPLVVIGNDQKFTEWKEWFDEKMWPLLREKARTMPGLYDFYMETGARSDAVIMFDYDAWTGNLALACLLAHGITHDIYGNLVPIEENDPMSTYIKENASLAFMRYRSKKAQEEIRRLQKENPGRKIKVGVFGGGADPTIWLDGLDLSNIEVVIYDLNPKMKGALEQILGQSLESLGVTFKNANFMDDFDNEAMLGTFDIIIYNGVMSYYPTLKAEIMKGTWGLLKNGGVMFFDDILQHPDMLFARYVRGWTVKLVPEESLEKAIEKNTKFLEEIGFSYGRYLCQKVRDIPNVLVNYAVKIAA